MSAKQRIRVCCSFLRTNRVSKIIFTDTRILRLKKGQEWPKRQVLIAIYISKIKHHPIRGQHLNLFSPSPLVFEYGLNVCVCVFYFGVRNYVLFILCRTNCERKDGKSVGVLCSVMIVRWKEHTVFFFITLTSTKQQCVRSRVLVNKRWKTFNKNRLFFPIQSNKLVFRT